jgi:hypothetical protein
VQGVGKVVAVGASGMCSAGRVARVTARASATPWTGPVSTPATVEMNVIAVSGRSNYHHVHLGRRYTVVAAARSLLATGVQPDEGRAPINTPPAPGSPPPRCGDHGADVVPTDQHTTSVP